MTMSRLLYTLEDHFDSLADRRKGRVSGWLCRCLSNVFAVLGDIWQAEVAMRRHRARSRGTLPV
jgi:hypothetical protein